MRLNINNVFDEEYYPEMENNYLATDDSTNYMELTQLTEFSQVGEELECWINLQILGFLFLL